MNKKQRQGRAPYHYDDQGVMQVSQQIMDSYNSGIIPEEQMKTASKKE
ncbi:hypothetical protein [Mesobacillus stamsii]|uniref:DUF4025 domain-containing protein n=1 Tax=Mesobacillus stamsii TaxID=225347 RepID=A0ABU0FST9_9BACI|nr:hypothetical protein [Mesobacillus stamsii]MDQ0412996.1 hypothetical protein [Mesobacillus stamsii]